MNQGPDLGAICDEHVASEFEAKDIDATMRTMVDEPYVWNVPTLEGDQADRACANGTSRGSSATFQAT